MFAQTAQGKTHELLVTALFIDHQRQLYIPLYPGPVQQLTFWKHLTYLCVVGPSCGALIRLSFQQSEQCAVTLRFFEGA